MSERDEREMIEKNISLSIEFSKYIFEHPEFDDKIPKGAQVVLLPLYDEDLSGYNLKIAEGQREKGQPVVYVRIEQLLAPRLSSPFDLSAFTLELPSFVNCLNKIYTTKNKKQSPNLQ